MSMALMIFWLDCSHDGEVFHGLADRAVGYSSTDSWLLAALLRTEVQVQVVLLFAICHDLLSRVYLKMLNVDLYCISSGASTHARSAYLQEVSPSKQFIF